MPTFVIPDQQQTALVAIRRLPDESVDRLVAALERVEPTRKSPDVIEMLNVQAPDLMPSDDLRSVVSTLYSLYNLRALVDVSLTRFVRDLLTAIKDSGNELLQFSDVERADFEKRLLKLLNISPLNLSSKAFTLQREHEHLFHDAQLFTDLRPVFGTDPSQDPIGMVIAYSLKLVYHGGTQHDELYLALDSDDIAKLKKMIERTEAKAETLRRLLDAKQIRRMTP